jgi:prepilin peptidase CpaA
MLESILLLLVGGAIVAGAAYDVTTFTIPNWISLVLLALFPFVAIAAGLTWAEVGIHAGMGFAALVVGRIIGGGDAKLFAAVSLYVGFAWFGIYVFAVAVAGGLLAFAVLALRRAAAYGFGAQFQWVQNLAKSSTGIPYGVAIAAGGLFVLPGTQLFLDAVR